MVYTLEQTKALLDAQVAKKGEDYTFTDACMYFEYADAMDNGYYTEVNYSKPLCIIGHVFADIGVEITASENASEFKGTFAASKFDEQSVKLLSVAQWEQDHGRPWGLAVKFACERIEQTYGISLS